MRKTALDILDKELRLLDIRLAQFSALEEKLQRDTRQVIWITMDCPFFFDVILA